MTDLPPVPVRTTGPHEEPASRSGPARGSDAARAIRDLQLGFRKRWIWWNLAIQDILMRYRGSVLGPFWVTASTMVLAGAMGLIYPKLFNVPSDTYIPYIFVSMVLWHFISAIIADACTTFVSQAGVIQQVPLPLSLHAYRVVAKGALVLAHSAVTIPFVLLFYRIPVTWHVLEVVPALAILFLNGVALALVIGAVSARFRDIPPIVTNFLQVAFFATPIFWPIEALGSSQIYAALNPLFVMIDIIRAPLIGQVVKPTSWPIALAVTALNVSVSFMFFAKFRKRIAFWV